MNSAGNLSLHLSISAVRPLRFIQSMSEREVGRIARRHRFHFFQKRGEFFLVELPVKIQTEKKIGEGDLLTHLQVLREAVGALEFVVLHRVGEQGAQGTGAKRRDLGKALESLAGGRAFF